GSSFMCKALHIKMGYLSVPHALSGGSRIPSLSHEIGLVFPVAGRQIPLVFPAVDLDEKYRSSRECKPGNSRTTHTFRDLASRTLESAHLVHCNDYRMRPPGWIGRNSPTRKVRPWTLAKRFRGVKARRQIYCAEPWRCSFEFQELWQSRGCHV